MNITSYPTCTCGRPGSWHGDRNGLRTFLCDDCYSAQQFNSLPEHWSDCTNDQLAAIIQNGSYGQRLVALSELRNRKNQPTNL